MKNKIYSSLGKIVVLTLLVLVLGVNKVAAQTAVNICYGDSTLLVLDSYTGALQWESSLNDTTWVPVSGATNDSLLVTNQTGTIYYRAIAYQNGCKFFPSDTFRVRVNPQIVASAGRDTAICYGASVYVGTATGASGGIAPYSYTWSPATPLYNSASAYTVAGPLANTSYTLSVTDNSGCSATDVISIAVGAPCITDSLVINEVDYDQGSPDDKEFVELFNPSSSPISLVGKAVVFVNGNNNTEYKRVDLSPLMWLPAGAYLVVADSGVTVPISTLTIYFSGLLNNIQDGAPDGVVLLNTATETAIDAFSYEGSITTSIITGVTTSISLVEGTALPASTADSAIPGSLVRLPNGKDTNNASLDWTITSTPTPGALNQ